MKTFQIVILAALVACAGISYSADRETPSPNDKMQFVGEVQWLYNFQDLPSMVQTAEAIVVADWVDASLGRTFLLPDGTALPFTLNRFAVRRVLKGALAEGAQITLEQTGGRTSELVASIDDGGPYTSGQYLLFLSQQPDTGFYVILHPQGRYKILRNRLLAVDREQPVSAQLNDRNLRDVLAQIHELRGRQ